MPDHSKDVDACPIRISLNSQLSAASHLPSEAITDKTMDAFSQELAPLQSLLLAIKTGGPSVWLRGVDTRTNNSPIRYVAQGENFLTVGVALADDALQIIQEGSDGDQPRSFGYVYINLTTGPNEGSQVIQLCTATVEMMGVGISGLDSNLGTPSLLEKILDSVEKLLSKLMHMIFQRVEVKLGLLMAINVVESSLKIAAEESTAEGEALLVDGATAAFSVSVKVVESLNIAINVGILAINLVLHCFFKDITSYVRFYNDTDHEVTFSLGWIKEGSAAAFSPAPINAPVYVPARGATWTPSAIIGPNATSCVDLVFTNTDSSEGLGFVLKGLHQGDFPGLSVMVNIPNTGDNSLYCQLTEEDDSYGLWQREKDKNTALSSRVVSGTYTLTISTNANSGKSPSPIDGAQGYNHEHLIVLTQASV